MRPTWNSFYLGIALAASSRGDCTRSQVGAILVKRLPDGRHLTSIGYNGTDPGIPGCLSGACPRGRLSYDELPSDRSNYSSGAFRCISYHAEDNAIVNAAFNIHDAVVYVTREPCDDCHEIMLLSGITASLWPTGMKVYDATSAADMPNGFLH
jgi:dCMP deaminase